MDIAKSGVAVALQKQMKSKACEFRTKSAQSGALEKAARENEFWSPAALTKCGGLCAKARVYGNFRAVESQRRMFDPQQLAAEMRFGLSVRSRFRDLYKSMA
jgi:hypothetical protein